MIKTISLLLIMAGSSCCWAADTPRYDAPVAVGQPTVFWVNGQWQTWKAGVWTPYGQEVDPPNRTVREGISSGETHQGAARPQKRPGKRGKIHGKTGAGRTPGVAELPQSDVRRDQPNIAIGETTIGIGQPNVAIGQPQGIGRPNAGLGRPNTSIGQTTIGIGRQNEGMGQPNGMGRTTIGIGQPNTGLGQPHGIGQTTIGIGKQREFIKSDAERSR